MCSKNGSCMCNSLYTLTTPLSLADVSEDQPDIESVLMDIVKHRYSNNKYMGIKIYCGYGNNGYRYGGCITIRVVMVTLYIKSTFL